ncbi:MAG: hypothetical protein HZB15_16215 [Actinobacteria bacterium]|nr:hypothetical protein [Actinomycetota bacterium]
MSSTGEVPSSSAAGDDVSPVSRPPPGTELTTAVSVVSPASRRQVARASARLSPSATRWATQSSVDADDADTVATDMSAAVHAPSTAAALIRCLPAPRLIVRPSCPSPNCTEGRMNVEAARIFDASRNSGVRRRISRGVNAPTSGARRKDTPMSTISPDQLPTPVPGFAAPAGSPFAAPTFATPSPVVPVPRRRANVRLVAAAVAGLVLVGGGVAAATRDSSGSATSPERPAGQTDDGGRAVPVDSVPVDSVPVATDVTDLAGVYRAAIGVDGSATTLDCLAAELDADTVAAQHVADWAAGAQLSLDEAQAAYTPFVACAPDADYLAIMVPAAVMIVGGNADEACITQILQSFGVDGRAEAYALAYADAAQFQERMYSTFTQCAL